MTSRPTPIPWTDDERVQLRQLWDNGLGAVRIGLLMGRSKHSVATQLVQLGLRRPSPFRAATEPPQRVRMRARPLKAGQATLPPLASLAGR